jgi:hypothetical protein
MKKKKRLWCLIEMKKKKRKWRSNASMFDDRTRKNVERMCFRKRAKNRLLSFKRNNRVARLDLSFRANSRLVRSSIQVTLSQCTQRRRRQIHHRWKRS